MSIVLRQRPASSLDSVADQLRQAFLASQQAMNEGDAVVLIVNASDLLGQGSVEDAAIATGLLGLMRALTFEGGSKGWRINLIAVDNEAEPPSDLLEFAKQSPSIFGQVLGASSGLVGKVIP